MSSEFPGRVVELVNLTTALRTSYERTGRLADLDEAIELGRQAVDMFPSDGADLDPERDAEIDAALDELGLALRSRFAHAGQSPDLNEAIEVGRRHLMRIPADHPDRAMELANLGLSLRFRFESAGDPADLDEAVEASRSAVQTIAADDPSGGRLPSRFL